ncbi:type II secretion system F family protein [Galbitalea sp. SE-J8]|uniref:type II secretion system F family protein n=1 Tax=Galbitalea sp. SE-J8 TaxID=3054952 RepID=UPI00259CE477|nr:type II secretion system F family protein [Galbitalea sp. SE-J8]MDM4763568.1 type II secretion system F family protein [Galbitalea sp. SE-J8]
MVRVSAALPLAIVLGLALGVGAWLVVSALPRLGRPTLMARVAPFVVDVSPAAREYLDRRTANPLPVLGLVLSPVARPLVRLLDALLGGSASLGRRLAQAGSALRPSEFRIRQLLWGAGGAGLGVLVAVTASRSVAVPPLASVGIVAVLAVLGVVVRDTLLQRAARARVARMAEELPTVLEFLTLSLAAGESILDAIRRVARVSRGELARELAGVATAVATGLPLADSLAELAGRMQLPPLTRSVEQIVGALERGTPLVEVLRAQAQDVRVDAKRELLEAAGKKEVAMLVPLVFLILPVTVVFALWPGVVVLQTGF